ncbi:YidC/Oxa1 family insertase periplasmic-domain containing protein [Puniceicoccaceae bacterium K14]|nr:YidC/Oxa1 family insertase periplasmic-domain containing protein [Puniceicoccaceae bacterium K14]
MDKKNTIIGIALLVTSLGLMWYTGQTTPQPQEQIPAAQPSGEDATSYGTEPPAQISAADSASPATVASTANNGRATVESNGSHSGELITPLENDFIEARFTNYGGDIKEIVLKEFKAKKDGDEPYVMNRLRYAPALSITNLEGASKTTAYQQVNYGNPDMVGFKTVIDDRLEIERRYTISHETEEEKPYTIRHDIVFRNLTNEPLATGNLSINIGTLAPSGAQDRELLAFSHSDGDDVKFIKSHKFNGGGIPLISKGTPKDFISGTNNVAWLSVKNPFFITILTPDSPGIGYVTRPVVFPQPEGSDEPNTGITGEMTIASLTIPAESTQSLGFDFYAGPKEHGRLEKMDKGQEQAMQFGFFGFFSKLLLKLMTSLYDMVHNYGLAIILLTLVVRTVLLPINLMSSKSMKRMAKISEPMKALKEKIPDNPQQQQKMMMELYKLNKINPVAGCLPMVAQIPIFFALFYMLRGAAELRFEEFLWISDLSKPDTVAHIGGIPLNLLPFVWVITMAVQMWTMPTPSVDNAQAKLMKFMPFIFFPFTYGFASGLVLYWSISNLFTILQQWAINRKKDEFEVIIPPAMKKIMDGKSGKNKKRR